MIVLFAFTLPQNGLKCETGIKDLGMAISNLNDWDLLVCL